MSTGLTVLASGAMCGRILACVASLRGATVSPSCTIASVARMPGPPELVTIATRLPCGTGWVASADA